MKKISVYKTYTNKYFSMATVGDYSVPQSFVTDTLAEDAVTSLGVVKVSQACHSLVVSYQLPLLWSSDSFNWNWSGCSRPTMSPHVGWRYQHPRHVREECHMSRPTPWEHKEQHSLILLFWINSEIRNVFPCKIFILRFKI